MDEFLSKYVYLLLIPMMRGGYVAFGFYRAKRRSPDGKADYSLFGPLSGYLEHRCGFTRRELIGWGTVIGVMLFAMFFTVITGVRRRGA